MFPLGRRLRRAFERRWFRWGLFAAAVVLAAGGALLLELLRIKADLDAGRQTIADIDLITVGEQGGIAAVAQRAVDRFDAADDRARNSPVLRVLSAVPVPEM